MACAATHGNGKRVAGVSLELRSYQRDAITAIHDAAWRGRRRVLVELPTGTGKTIVFATLITERGGRALVLVHRDELVRQAVEKMALVAPTAHVGVVKAERDEVEAAVVVASVQTLSREARLARLGRDFQTVIIDEAHHVVADSYVRILAHLGVGQPDGPLGVGVTATPQRADGQRLDDWEIVYRRELLEMIRHGYLANIRAVQVQLAADFNALHVRAGDFVEREVEELLLSADAPRHAAMAYQEHAAGRKALVFTPTVMLAHEMAKAFESTGVRAEAIDGETPLGVRRETLRRFHRGETRVVANCGVLTEGFDEESVDCIVVARPTRSKPLYIQILGRGTRLYPGKPDCLVIDLVGATRRHDLMTLDAAVGLAPKRARVLAERGLLVAAAEEQEEQTRVEQHGRLVAETVELFRQRPLHWVPARSGGFALTTGSGVLLLEQAPNAAWRVVLCERDAGRVLADGLPLDYAQGVAEDHARKVGATTLADPNARWRHAPPTDRQLRALRRLRVRPRPGLTRGEASDLLTARSAAVGMRG